MKSDKHIVWLVPGFADGETDTTCLTYLQAMLRTFKKNHPEVTITVFSFQYPFSKGWYKLFDCDIFSAGGKNRKGLIRFQTWYTIMTEVKKVHKKNPIALIQSFWLTECAMIGQLLSKKHLVPHIAYLMGQDCLPKNRYHSLFRFSKFPIISVSDFAAQKYFTSTAKKVYTVIPLGMDVDFYDADKSVLRHIDILGAGSLIALKQYELFIEVILEVKKEFNDVKCELCGEGPLKEKLLLLIKEKKLTENITLCGSLSRKNVLEKMNRSKIFLHSSSFESLGYVFAEALYCGCNVVAFETGLIPKTEQSFPVQTKEEMIMQVKKNLRNKTINQQQNVFTMKETVIELQKIYSKYYSKT
jgi:glycosyltransferase involved in cell wall biosynthesis